MLGKMFCSLEYRDSWRQPGNADEKKKIPFIKCVYVHKEQSNFEYKVGSQFFWPGSQGRVPGNQGRVPGRENNCGGHTGLGYENVREKESHVDITALLDYLLH